MELTNNSATQLSFSVISNKLKAMEVSELQETLQLCQKEIKKVTNEISDLLDTSEQLFTKVELVEDTDRDHSNNIVGGKNHNYEFRDVNIASFHSDETRNEAANLLLRLNELRLIKKSLLMQLKLNQNLCIDWNDGDDRKKLKRKNMKQNKRNKDDDRLQRQLLREKRKELNSNLQILQQYKKKVLQKKKNNHIHRNHRNHTNKNLKEYECSELINKLIPNFTEKSLREKLESINHEIMNYRSQRKQSKELQFNHQSNDNTPSSPQNNQSDDDVII